MSGEADTKTGGTTDALLRRISELEGAVAKANGDAKKYRLRLRDKEKAYGELETAHKDLSTRFADLETKATQTPDEWKTKHDELQTQLRARDARDAWAESLGKDTLRDKVTVEKVWAEVGYTPGEAAPKPEEIAGLVDKARESAPYLFQEKVETTTQPPGGATKTPAKPPLKETVDVGRGAPDTSANRVTVRKSQLRDPNWALDPQNTKTVSDARSRGALDIVDD